mmetsp:Transcript_2008/g.7769  ORF Transcript_2008/g.7769 Transcript_2008/m.7769 type:complete len:209 (+) Transcript_2008:141-767(+)
MASSADAAGETLSCLSPTKAAMSTSTSRPCSKSGPPEPATGPVRTREQKHACDCLHVGHSKQRSCLRIHQLSMHSAWKLCLHFSTRASSSSKTVPMQTTQMGSVVTRPLGQSRSISARVKCPLTCSLAQGVTRPLGQSRSISARVKCPLTCSLAQGLKALSLSACPVGPLQRRLQTSAAHPMRPQRSKAESPTTSSLTGIFLSSESGV